MKPVYQYLEIATNEILICLDLLQVDLLASGASLFWPRSGLFFWKSKYEIRRRTFLKVYHLPYHRFAFREEEKTGNKQLSTNFLVGISRTETEHSNLKLEKVNG